MVSEPRGTDLRMDGRWSQGSERGDAGAARSSNIRASAAGDFMVPLFPTHDHHGHGA